MSVRQYDVVVVGAGCAGLTAAIGLARAGFAVAVVEAAPMLGGANEHRRRLLRREPGSARHPRTRGRRGAGLGAPADRARQLRHRWTTPRRQHLPRSRGFSPLLHRPAIALRSSSGTNRPDARRRPADGDDGREPDPRGPAHHRRRHVARPAVRRSRFSRRGRCRPPRQPRGTRSLQRSARRPAFLYCLQQVIDLPAGPSRSVSRRAGSRASLTICCCAIAAERR